MSESSEETTTETTEQPGAVNEGSPVAPTTPEPDIQTENEQPSDEVSE